MYEKETENQRMMMFISYLKRNWLLREVKPQKKKEDDKKLKKMEKGRKEKN